MFDFNSPRSEVSEARCRKRRTIDRNWNDPLLRETNIHMYMIPSCQRPAAPGDIHTQSENASTCSKGGSKGGSRGGSKSTGYHFQRFQGEGCDEYSQFESVNLLSLEAAEALCSRLRDGIPVEVCLGHIHSMSEALQSTLRLRLESHKIFNSYKDGIHTVVVVAVVPAAASSQPRCFVRATLKFQNLYSRGV